MIDTRRPDSWLRSITLACAVAGLSGCSEELGPKPLVVTRVKGFVREGDRPVKSGWIEFFPIDGTVGNLRSARIQADGSFEADHVAVGLNLVCLPHAALSTEVAKRVFGAYTSPIRRIIPPRSTEPVVIDLIQEVVRYNDRQAANAGRQSRPAGGNR